MLITLPYGQEELEVTVPDSTRVEVAEPKHFIPVEDAKGEIYRALRNPIGTTVLNTILRTDSKIAIIASDITRDYLDDLVIPILVKECLEAGIAKENISVVVANGTHREITKDEMIKKYGQWVNDTVQVINHRANDPDNLVFLGKTKKGIPVSCNKTVALADFRIGTGGIDLHLLAGFSGGVKIMSVGVAGEETIAATHNIDIWEHPNSRLGVIEGNIFREFLTEAAEAIGLDFIFNVVQTSDHKLVRAFAGHHVQAFNQGVALARQIFEVEVENVADVVISCPRYPANCDIHQSTKAINAIFFGPEPIIKKDGVLFMPTRCQDGIGHNDIYKTLANSKYTKDVIDWAREKNYVNPGELISYKIARAMQISNIAITNCDIDQKILRQMHFLSYSNLQDGLDDVLSKNPNARLLVLPYGNITLPILSNNN